MWQAKSVFRIAGAEKNKKIKNHNIYGHYLGVKDYIKKNTLLFKCLEKYVFVT